MNNKALMYIIRELAETIDEALLPQTTVSSLGLKLALEMKPRLYAAMEQENGATEQERFTNALVKILTAEFDYKLLPEMLSEDCIRLKIDKCPFRIINSRSLCSIVQGVAGGLTFMTFGYCKVVIAKNQNRPAHACYIDLYIAQSQEAKEKSGIEYTKENIALLQGDDDKLVEQQRLARRKLILGLYSSIALSLRKQLSPEVLAQNFIESLSCITGIGVAGIYLKDEASGNFILRAYFGIPQDIVYSIREIGSGDRSVLKTDYDFVAAGEDFNWGGIETSRALRIRSFTSIRIKSENRIIGLLNIGWKSAAPASPEFREALRDACDLLGAAIDSSRLYAELEKSYIDSIGLINNLVSVVDHFSKDHARNVAELSEAIALKMGLGLDEARILYEAGFVHDIGKITIPHEILNKSGKLTPEEFELVKGHTLAGAKMLSPVTAFKEILPAVKYHHERFDGSGYPEGLTGDKIPLYARIVAVAEVYDAILSERAYRGAKKEEEAISELIDGKGTKYDPDAVNALIAVIEDRKQSSASHAIAS